MFLAIAAFNKERTKLFCIGHNFTTDTFNPIWEELKAKKAPVIHFTHALHHEGPAVECAGCIAAIEEAMRMAQEEEERIASRRGPPTAGTATGSPGQSVLGTGGKSGEGVL